MIMTVRGDYPAIGSKDNVKQKESPTYGMSLTHNIAGSPLSRNSKGSGLRSPDTRNACKVQAIFSTDGVKKIQVRDEGQASKCGQVVIRTNLQDVFLYPIEEINDDGEVIFVIIVILCS